MYMIMKAEVFENGEWRKVDKLFQSALQENLMTDRVCDERNPILYEVLGAPKTCRFEHDPLVTVGTYNKEKNNYIAYLDELVKYNWNTSVACIGTISEWQYKRLKSDGITPVNTNHYVRGERAKIVSSFEMDMISDNDELRDAQKYYVQHEYDIKPLSAYCEFFCKTTIPTLMKLVPPGGTMHDVRVIYSFVEPLTNM